MPYANGRTYLDADSHLMERPDFLRDFADAAVREKLPKINTDQHPDSLDWSGWQSAVEGTGHASAHVDAMVAMGDTLIAGPKGYMALGAFNPDERGQALNQLGFQRQLVFSSYSPVQTLHEGDLSIKYGAAAAHNRAMADFCVGDPRLLGVGMLPLDDPARAVGELENLLQLGLKAAWIAHNHCGGRSPGHNDLDPIWARLAEADVPFVLHVGGYPLQLPPAWMNTGRAVPTDWLGGGENIRGKDMIALHHHAELFLGAMIFDGVFERHPTLRGGAIELGAGWVPSWLRRLDWAAKIWRKEPELGALSCLPSETALEHLGFTPYVYEDVGQLIRESDSRLYLFSSDYPHFEGSKNPIERFETFLDSAGVDELAKDAFYSTNFERVFG
jgi:uncharacterized protein